MNPLDNPLRVCEDADRLEQLTELGADPAGLEEYPHTDHAAPALDTHI